VEPEIEKLAESVREMAEPFPGKVETSIVCPIDEQPCAKSRDCCFWPEGCSEVKHERD